MKRYLLTEEAKEDLADIRRCLARQANASIAKSTLTKIKQTFAFLSSTPGAGHVREDLSADQGEVLACLFLPDRI